MASVEKYNIQAVPNQIRHILRTINKPNNEDIDAKKKSLNYTLAPDREMVAYDYFKKRKSELYCYNRSDVKVMAGWIVTVPKDLPVNRHEDFFRTVYEFLAERYGIENVIEAVVHNDESGSAHLHFLFIPVTDDKKHGGQKICANMVLNRKELRNFHPDLQKYLRTHGIAANVYNGITQANGGNRTVKEMKQERKLKLKLGYDRTIMDRGRWD